LRQKLLTFALIGAGPAGVELASTLADWLPDWYAQLGGNPQEIRVVLINRGSQILSGDTNEHLRETALKALQQRAIPVELLTNAPVTALQPSKVQYEVKGRLGYMVRQLTYLQMLPTPVHNLKITAEWLTEEILHHAKTLV
jgi:NADH dehydrogenase FAD-containing subunit